MPVFLSRNWMYSSWEAVRSRARPQAGCTTISALPLLLQNELPFGLQDALACRKQLPSAIHPPQYPHASGLQIISARQILAS